MKNAAFYNHPTLPWETEPVFSLTFDTDNCPDEAMDYVQKKLEAHGFAGTFFCTRRYDTLHAPHEAGLHPFITVQTDFKAMVAPIAQLKAQIPEAVGNRCHQLAVNSTLYADLPGRGILYDSSWPMGFCPGISPIMLHTGLMELPLYWMEGLYFQQGKSPLDGELSYNPGLRIHLFHPVHLWHNSTQQSVQALFATPYKDRYKKELRQKGTGMDTHFDRLLSWMAEHKICCRTCADIAHEALHFKYPKVTR